MILFDYKFDISLIFYFIITSFLLFIVLTLFCFVDSIDFNNFSECHFLSLYTFICNFYSKNTAATMSVLSRDYGDYDKSELTHNLIKSDFISSNNS